MKVRYSADEIINTLNRSAYSAILLIEDGRKSDEPYRFIREQLQDLNIDFITCLGVGLLEQVFQQRLRITKPYTLFLRDRDLLVYGNVPANYAEIIFTTGYSIENDVYSETNIEELLNENERVNYNIAKQNFIAWYAYRIHQHLLDETTAFASLPYSILTKTYSLKAEHQVTPEQLEVSQTKYNEIFGSYSTLLRGHSLFNLLSIFLNAEGRNSTFDERQLMDYCVRELNPPLLMQLINTIRGRYNNRAEPIVQ